jgi:hypothetical protein
MVNRRGLPATGVRSLHLRVIILLKAFVGLVAWTNHPNLASWTAQCRFEKTGVLLINSYEPRRQRGSLTLVASGWVREPNNRREGRAFFAWGHEDPFCMALSHYPDSTISLLRDNG